MKAIIAAAGQGKRMLPLTEHLPKPMILLKNKPLLAHIIDSLPVDVDEILLVVGYKKEIIQNYFGDNYKQKKLHYIVQSQPTGTGDAIKLCKEFIKKGERFFLTWADDICDGESIAECLNNKYSCLVSEVSDPSRFGVLIVDKQNNILDIEEKPLNPKSNLVACGVFVLDTDIFNYQPNVVGNEQHFAGMLHGFLKHHTLRAVKAKQWIPIGFPEDLKKAETILNLTD